MMTRSCNGRMAWHRRARGGVALVWWRSSTLAAHRASSGNCPVREKESGEVVRVVQGLGLALYRVEKGEEELARRWNGGARWRPP
jgi:hypothetical protein